ncbi:MAG TPA: TonB C-terminal domain-containing protein [Vicinamibacterales bacterium]|nr:TonB C-terminal domain-containing protein [Vicinamibacterales bacterium]
MYFNFEDNHPDITPIGRAISWREGILLSIIFHLLVILLVVLMPEFPGTEAAARRAAEEAELRMQQEADQQPRFVFVQPQVDTPAQRPPSPRAEASDQDRVAQAPERAKDPTSSLPFSRGNTPERVDVPQMAAREAPSPEPRAEPGPTVGQPPTAEPPGENGEGGTGGAPQSALSLPGRLQPAPQPGEGTGRPGAPGVFAGAVQNPERYASQRFDNQGGGGGAFGPAIQFDTKGVEFGPWVRRFIAQIKRNWTIPYAAMAFRGHVVVTFNVHKNGALTDLMVVGPSDVQAFNNSSFGALAASNPTYPLPPEYPSDRAFFTVTFYYNEVPPER